jgi:hypothetical protein
MTSAAASVDEGDRRLGRVALPCHRPAHFFSGRNAVVDGCLGGNVQRELYRRAPSPSCLWLHKAFRTHRVFLSLPHGPWGGSRPRHQNGQTDVFYRVCTVVLPWLYRSCTVLPLGKRWTSSEVTTYKSRPWDVGAPPMDRREAVVKMGNAWPGRTFQAIRIPQRLSPPNGHALRPCGAPLW